MCVLFANLIVGGIVRMRRNRSNWGVLIAHLGIAFMLVAGFVKAYFAKEGHVTLYEGQSADHFESYFRWEIAVLEPLDATRVSERLAPHERFGDAQGANTITLVSRDLPFDLEVSHFLANCQPLPKGPMFEVTVPVVEGVFLQEEAPLKEGRGQHRRRVRHRGRAPRRQAHERHSLGRASCALDRQRRGQGLGHRPAQGALCDAVHARAARFQEGRPSAPRHAEELSRATSRCSRAARSARCASR
jgi:hypothetical protein